VTRILGPPSHMWRNVAVLVLAALVALPAMAGARPVCLYVIDLGGEDVDPVRDALLAPLLEDGCWTPQCDANRSYEYSLRRDLPPGMTNALARRAARGDEAALLKLRTVVWKELGDDYDWDSLGYFWDPDGVLVYERVRGGSVVRLTGISLEVEEGAVVRDFVEASARRLSNGTLDAANLADVMRRALRPILAHFVV
jgi:hypothetical protein